MGSLGASSSKLFEPLTIGSMKLQHRVIMAPLTRFRADDSHVPLPFVSEYYQQRASVPGTLIITEATLISESAGIYNNVPGIWNRDQVDAWRKITDAVHQKGSYIVLQLWTLGRVADPAATKQKGIKLPAPSPIPVAAGAETPEELTIAEIESFVAEYTVAAKNAIEAGFDGVEIHAANGYLVDQFLQDVSNTRADRYGGSIENRSRLGLEVTQAVVDAVGAERVGIRLSPFSTFQGMGMKDPIPQFTHFIHGLKALKLAYIHVVESRVCGNADVEPTHKIDFAVNAWDGTSPVLIAGGFTPESARNTADELFPDKDVAIVFGRYFISTPDLPFRVKHGIDLGAYDRNTFYKAKAEDGYIDYPFSTEFEQAYRN